MHLVLEAVSGPITGKRIEAKAGQTASVGRTRKANIVLGDKFMSGVHFEIKCGMQTCYVRDLNSRNGTKLNGTLITEAVVRNGDRVFAGHTEFIARVEA